MSSRNGFKHQLAQVSRLWEANDYDAALAAVEALRKGLPGNAHLLVLWARLVQLQDSPQHTLDEAKQALQQAVDLESGSPAAAIELGHFLDNVCDDPRAAVQAYAAGVSDARHLLIDGLLGQAQALLQLGQRQEWLRCLLEVVYLTRGTDNDADGNALRSSPYAERIEALLGELAEQRAV